MNLASRIDLEAVDLLGCELNRHLAQACLKTAERAVAS
jgi:hypothetical protein